MLEVLLPVFRMKQWCLRGMPDPEYLYSVKGLCTEWKKLPRSYAAAAGIWRIPG